MAYTRSGAVTTYEWAIQAFDEYPDQPTRLAPGKRIGLDVAVVDKDSREAHPTYTTWGDPPTPFKGLDASSLGELIMGDDP
jgi:hypothetical protein